MSQRNWRPSAAAYNRVMGIEHDSEFRALFAWPEMVGDLLRSFVPPEIGAALDLSSLERVNGSYATQDGTQRHSDMVWKVRVAGEWLYLYILLEFQSQPDRWMGLRMQVYVGLMYQDLVKRRELPSPHRLPPVLRIVLYSGTRPWRVATSLRMTIRATPPLMISFQPEQRYLLLSIRELAKRNGYSTVCQSAPGRLN